MKNKRIIRTLLVTLYFLTYFAYSQTQAQQPLLLTPEYLHSVQQKIGLNFIYPPEAKDKGWQGVVKVKFTLSPAGWIKKIEVVESTGHLLLDAAAILAIRNACPLPLPKVYKGPLEIVLPISYQQATALINQTQTKPKTTFLPSSPLTPAEKHLISEGSTSITPNYLQTLQEKIGHNFIYPPKAKAQGWQGIVRLRFILSSAGWIKKISVAESSGYPLLDAAAILTIRNSCPFPLPKDLKGGLEIVLPISYQLVKAKSAKAQKKPKTAPLPEKPLAEAEKSVAQSKPLALKPAKIEEKTKPPILPAKAPVAEKKTPLPLTPSVPKEEVTLFPPGQIMEILPVETKEEQASLPQELNSFVDIALKNNKSIEVAREEVELSQMKITEARRAFFPGFKLSGYNTNGKVYEINTEEREAKAEVTQPLFYGGRLVDTLNQAKTNYEISAKNYDRLKLDVVQKTEIAYHNLVAAKMNLGLKEALRQEAVEILGKIEKLTASGMAIPLELKSSRAWFKQLEFQRDNIKQDLLMAELTFRQILNVEEMPQVKTSSLERKAVNLDLNRCQDIAMRSRPEVSLSNLLIEFNTYSQKIEDTKNKAFTVDLISSYGVYKGHYKTEPWRNAENWSTGVKVSKPWGPSTLNSSYTTEKSQPRIGQTTSSKSSTASGDVNLFDNMKRLSDKKRADIDLHRSLSDYNETVKTITFEVRDAFLNYQKAVLQLRTAELDMEYRKNELEITKIRAMVGEANLSNAVEAIYHYSEAQSRYIQALANHLISLANLKKACGYGLQL